jgi:hypothetical protein
VRDPADQSNAEREREREAELGPALAAAAAALRTAPTPRPDPLMVAAAALREVDTAAPPDVAATRVRVMASLERRGHGRRKRVVVAAVLASLGTGTLSWAAATGRVQRVITEITRAPDMIAVYGPFDGGAPDARSPRKLRPGSADDAVVRADRIAAMPMREPVVPPPVPPAPELAATTGPVAIPVPEAPVAAQPGPPVAKPARRAPKRVAAPAPVEDTVDRELYLRAHVAHFRGSDAGVALAAWDEYLAQRPRGRFAVEARYNRALALLRLDRRDDARAALTPFAAGDVEGDYRRRDARELIDALDRADRADGAESRTP